MHISKLYLFAKDTDAVETSKGFKYQELKTLEAWIENRVNNRTIDIYCDYEEDILQRDLSLFKSKFTQLKLYSSKNFSFASEEVKKGIAHFFTLFVKGEYLMDEVQFELETNTGIAANREGNDADLLREWSVADHMADDLLNRCVTKIKALVDEYIHSEISKAKENKPDLLEAAEVYKKIPLETWQTFVKSIKWTFHDIPADDALQQSMNSCLELINALPYPIAQSEHLAVFDRLRGIVSDRSIQTLPENRLLNNTLLDKQMLMLGDDADRAYEIALSDWADGTIDEHFTIGQFVQVLLAAKYCRKNSYLKHNSKFWLQLLRQIIDLDSFPKALRRQAVYELVWLTLRPSREIKEIRDIKGLESEIRWYFSDCHQFTNSHEVDDAVNLFTIVAASAKLGRAAVTAEEVDLWRRKLLALIASQKDGALDKNQVAKALESEAFMLLNDAEGYGKVVGVLDEIVKVLPDAPLYPVSQLGRKLDELVALYVKFEIADKTQMLEDFSEKLLPYVQKREGNFSAAKRYVQKGVDHLKTTDRNSMLKAIDFFHKAKDLYWEDSTAEGFVLALFNVGQLYSAIGMQMAAKYYMLLAVWYCNDKDDPKLFKRLSDASGLIFHIDFTQGAWLTALIDFEAYISIRNSLNATVFDPEYDSMLGKTLTQAACLTKLSPMFIPALTDFIARETQRMDILYNDYLRPIELAIDKKVTETGRMTFITDRVDQFPVNDVGTTRHLIFNALGIEWTIEFENNYFGTSVGEEFAALAQIILTEIAYHRRDFCLVASAMKITVANTKSGRKPPEDISSEDGPHWKVNSALVESKEAVDKEHHYTHLTASFVQVLGSISLLPLEKVMALIGELKAAGLDGKVFLVNIYQKAFRLFYEKPEFDVDIRQTAAYTPEKLPAKPNVYVLPPEGTSQYLDKDAHLDKIRGRAGVFNRTAHLTLARLKTSEEFKKKLEKWRHDGWLDWQIAMAVNNNLIDLKARNILGQNGKNYTNQEDWFSDHTEMISELYAYDESETYVEVPMEILTGEHLDMQLSSVPINILGSLGLKSHAKYLDPSSIKKYLDEHFRFSTLDVPDVSPFKDF